MNCLPLNVFILLGNIDYYSVTGTNECGRGGEERGVERREEHKGVREGEVRERGRSEGGE